MPPGSLSSSAALAAFIEPFIESRRALVFGSALSTTPRLLLERGARLVHVCDPAPLRVAEAVERAAAPGLSFSTFSDETLSTRDGSFDCILVENLGAFDARSVVARARRLLSPRGVALFVTPNREALAPLLPPPEPSAAPLDYYALYDLVAGEFEHVRMLGQAPFVGYAVVDFAPDAAPEPSIDSEFIPRGSEEPELFVALASRHKTGLAGYAVVQLPLHRVLSGSAVSPRAQLPPEPAVPVELVRKLKQQEGWISELEARAETADQRADQAEEEIERLTAELARAQKAALVAARVELPPAPPVPPAPLPTPPPRTEPTQPIVVEPPTQSAEQQALAAELERLRGRVRELETKLSERDAARAVLESTIAERDARIEELLQTPPADATSDFDALERQLAERGEVLRRVEHELAESERVGRELLFDLSRRKTHTDPELARQLEVLSERLAASEADRVALGWAAAVSRTS
jgi:SAM-dependent methyltransferase